MSLGAAGRGEMSDRASALINEVIEETGMSRVEILEEFYTLLYEVGYITIR